MVQEDLIQLAFEVREFADQYRNFNVGGVVLGLRFEEDMTKNRGVIWFDAKTIPTGEKD